MLYKILYTNVHRTKTTAYEWEFAENYKAQMVGYCLLDTQPKRSAVVLTNLKYSIGECLRLLCVKTLKLPVYDLLCQWFILHPRIDPHPIQSSLAIDVDWPISMFLVKYWHITCRKFQSILSGTDWLVCLLTISQNLQVGALALSCLLTNQKLQNI